MQNSPRSAPKRSVLSVGSVVLGGKYTVLQVIANRGMSNVYLVVDNSLGQKWAIKEIIFSEHMTVAEKREYRALVNEANILKDLSHTHLPRIVSIEKEQDSRLIVMDYIEGESIQEILNRQKMIPVKDAVLWVSQVLEVLGYLHNRRPCVLYRDLKPANIMVQSNGNIKMLDFGISVMMTSENQIIQEPLGTHGFAAPEQARVGLPYDLRSDIYAVGKMLYYLVTGSSPALKDSEGKQVNLNFALLSEKSLGLSAIVEKCVKPNPEERYQTIEEVIVDLENFSKVDGLTVKRKKTRVRLVFAFLALAVALGVGSLIPLRQAAAYTKKEFSERVYLAEISGKPQDYYSALTLDPVNPELLLTMIEATKTDGILSGEEERMLLDILNPNIILYRSQLGYGDLAFEVGKVYWFYSSGSEATRAVSSIRWFEDAVKYNCTDILQAGLFVTVGEFNRDINKNIQESKDSGKYGVYWSALRQAKSFYMGELMELQIYSSLVSCVQAHAYRMKLDGVTRESMELELESLNYSIQIMSEPQSSRAREIHQLLPSMIEGARNAVEVAFSSTLSHKGG